MSQVIRSIPPGAHGQFTGVPGIGTNSIGINGAQHGPVFDALVEHDIDGPYVKRHLGLLFRQRQAVIEFGQQALQTLKFGVQRGLVGQQFLFSAGKLNFKIVHFGTELKTYQLPGSSVSFLRVPFHHCPNHCVDRQADQKAPGRFAERVKVGLGGAIVGPHLNSRVTAQRLREIDDWQGAGPTSGINQVRGGIEPGHPTHSDHKRADLLGI